MSVCSVLVTTLAMQKALLNVVWDGGMDGGGMDDGWMDGGWMDGEMDGGWMMDRWVNQSMDCLVD